jgi:hypothetical protein
MRISAGRLIAFLLFQVRINADDLVLKLQGPQKHTSGEIT